jgi:hypothetical protein
MVSQLLIDFFPASSPQLIDRGDDTRNPSAAFSNFPCGIWNWRPHLDLVASESLIHRLDDSIEPFFSGRDIIE